MTLANKKLNVNARTANMGFYASWAPAPFKANPYLRDKACGMPLSKWAIITTSVYVMSILLPFIILGPLIVLFFSRQGWSDLAGNYATYKDLVERQ